jgi:hypothetical protein
MNQQFTNTNPNYTVYLTEQQLQLLLDTIDFSCHRSVFTAEQQAELRKLGDRFEAMILERQTEK